MSTVEIEIPSRSAYVRVVRLALTSLARAAGLEEETVDDLKIAVSEACANAVIANEQAGSDEGVRVVWSEEDERIVVDIADRRSGPEPASLADSQGFDTRLVMSEALLDTLVDGMEVIPRDGGGATTRLTVSRT